MQITGLPKWCSGLKNPPAMQEMQIWSLGQEDPLEYEMETQYSYLENSMDRGVWHAPVHGTPKNQTWLNVHYKFYHGLQLLGPFCEFSINAWRILLWNRIYYKALNFTLLIMTLRYSTAYFIFYILSGWTKKLY